MPATFLNEITDDQIRHQIERVAGVEIRYTGRADSNRDLWQTIAREKFAAMTVDDVREALENDLSGDSPEDEIGMAISIACEPAELPENASVDLVY